MDIWIKVMSTERGMSTDNDHLHAFLLLHRFPLPNLIINERNGHVIFTRIAWYLNGAEQQQKIDFKIFFVKY